MRTVLALVLLLAAALPAAAERAVEVRLTPEMREALAAAPPIRNGTPARDALEGRVVVVTFFATWCMSCLIDMDAVAEAARVYDPRQVTFVAVNIHQEHGPGDTQAGLTQLLERLRPGFPVLVADRALAEAFGNPGVPARFVFDAGGRALLPLREYGGRTYVVPGDLEEGIRAALARAG